MMARKSVEDCRSIWLGIVRAQLSGLSEEARIALAHELLAGIESPRLHPAVAVLARAADTRATALARLAFDRGDL